MNYIFSCFSIGAIWIDLSYSLEPLPVSVRTGCVLRSGLRVDAVCCKTEALEVQGQATGLL
jgi:non-homologous end joining protein Ku